MASRPEATRSRGGRPIGSRRIDVKQFGMAIEGVMTWADVLADKSLQDLPYKIELNGNGKIELIPAGNRHAIEQALP